MENPNIIETSKKKMKKTLKALLPLLERGFSIAALIFPLVEAIAYFGPKVFLNTESLALKNFYVSYIDKLGPFSFLWFGYFFYVLVDHHHSQNLCVLM